MGILSTLSGKRHNEKEDMVVNIEEFQQNFTQLERMGFNVVSEDFKVTIWLYSFWHNSPPGSTLAAFRTRDLKELFWQEVTSELIVESGQSRISFTYMRKIETNQNCLFRFKDFFGCRDCKYL